MGRHWQNYVCHFHLKGQKLVDVDGFTGTSWSGAQNVFLGDNEHFHQVLHSDGIGCWHDNISECSLVRN